MKEKEQKPEKRLCSNLFSWKEEEEDENVI